jgi:DNA invertase Pin-like site-specific DNA recombinase
MTTINTCPQDPAPVAMAVRKDLTLGYGRVSTARQGLSREAQTETVQRAAAFHVGGPDSGPDAVSSEMFFDDDTSGSIPFVDRPAGRQLLARVRDALAAGLSPTIIVTKVDRLGRDTVDVSQTVTLFESLGARIVFLDINVDTRTAMGRAFMQIAAVFAELERARIRERIQTTLDLKRSQNLVIGTVPYGWDDRPTGTHNKAGKPIRELVPNEAEQATILDMARQKIAGISLTRIAQDLNRRGIATKRRGERLNIGNVKGQCQVKPAFGIWSAGIVLKCLTNKTVQAFLATHETD